MSNPIIVTSPVKLSDASNTDTKIQVVNPVEKLTQQAEARAHLNASILKTSIEVSIKSQNEPLALLLKSAINGINDVLKPQFGENAIQNAVGQDNTPEGTAGRIVSLSTGFFEAFKLQHPWGNEADLLKKFMAIITGGMQHGFKEAREILQGMNVLTGDIASNIDKTYKLVLKGYADFEASLSSSSPLSPGKM
jgi:hypothetical protein